MNKEKNEKYIRRCNELARDSFNNGDNFFGSLIVYNNKIIVESLNDTKKDITGHAEVIAIKKIIKERPEIPLSECTLYTNFEPCPMCSFLIRDIGIGGVVFSAKSPFWGGYSRWDILTTNNMHDYFTSNGNSIPPKVIPFVLENETSEILKEIGWKMHLPEFSNNIKDISYSDEDKEITLINLSKKIKNSDSENIKNIFFLWNKIKKNINFDKITQEVRASNSYLFEESMSSNEKVLNYNDFLMFLNEKNINLLNTLNKNANKKNIIEKIKNKIYSTESDFIYHSRILNKNEIENKIKKNGYRALADSLGIRIVIKNNKKFIKFILNFENNFKDNIICKLNTFSFDKKKFSEILGKSSFNYKAMHYYLLIDGLIVEVQFRMWATSLWADLHHQTLYKKNILIIPIEKKSLEEFGNIANIVDFSLLIN